MGVVAIAVHEDDGAGAQPGLAGGLQLLAQFIQVQGPLQLTVGADALARFDDALVEQLGQLDMLIEEARPRLVGDAQRIAIALGDDQHGGLALALQQRIGGHRGAHLHAFHLGRRNGLMRPQAEQAAYALHRGIAVLLGVLGQQLEGVQPAIRRAPHQIGESATAVDPELPAL